MTWEPSGTGVYLTPRQVLVSGVSIYFPEELARRPAGGQTGFLGTAGSRRVRLLLKTGACNLQSRFLLLSWGQALPKRGRAGAGGTGGGRRCNQHPPHPVLATTQQGEKIPEARRGGACVLQTRDPNTGRLDTGGHSRRRAPRGPRALAPRQ